jgi:hypothetical protein
MEPAIVVIATSKTILFAFIAKLPSHHPDDLEIQPSWGFQHQIIRWSQ